MNLYLIGYRGAGKSVTARFLAERLGWPLIQCDRLIEEKSGQTVAEIFAGHGEPKFRQYEKDVLLETAKLDRHVIDLGGGAVIDPENRKRVLQSGKCVWLQATAEVLWDRIRNDRSTTDSRPNLTQLEGLAEVEQLLAERQPIYAECAEFSIGTDELSPQEVAEKIANWCRDVDTI